MRLTTFMHNRQPRLGLVLGDQVIDLAAAVPGVPADLRAALEAGTDLGAAAKAAVAAPASAARRLPLAHTPAPAFAAVGAERVRAVGFDVMGTPRVLDLDLAAAPEADLAPRAELLQRDWPAALGAALDDDGEPTVSNR